jgi:hypothetical protein
MRQVLSFDTAAGLSRGQYEDSIGVTLYPAIRWRDTNGGIRRFPSTSEVLEMKYDDQKIAETVLALLGVFEFDNGRVWKRIDFDVMDRLFEQGYITNPKGKTESVYLTEEGMRFAKELAARHFSAPPLKR